MKKIIALIAYLALFLPVNSQISKISGINSSINTEETSSIQSLVDSFEVFQLDLSSYKSGMIGNIDTIQLTIKNKYNWKLVLVQNNLLSENCLLTESNGLDVKLLSNKCSTFKGYEYNFPENQVRLSIYGNIYN